MRNFFKISLAWAIAVVAVSAFVASPALAQPKLGGNAGVSAGYQIIDANGNVTGQDIDGMFVSMESNLVVTGTNDTLDYRFRLRFRGKSQQSGDGGDTNLFGSAPLQTFRGHVRVAVSDALSIRIGKPAVSSVTTTTELDDIQGLDHGFNVDDLFDRGIVDIAYKAGGNTFGVMLSPETPSGMSTSGVGTGGAEAGTGNLTIQPWAKLKFGAIGLNLQFTTSSGDGVGTGGFSGGATATHISPSFDFGAGKVYVDIASATSDLNPSGEFETTATGFLVDLKMGLVFNYRIEEITNSTSASTDREQTNLGVYYKIPAGDKGWHGPSFQTQTNSLPNATSTPDQEMTLIRYNAQIKF